jgi:hypothetical protein
MGLWMKLMVSYLISFPLMTGEGWDGGGPLGPFPPPPESSPTVGLCHNTQRTDFSKWGSGGWVEKI